MDLKANKAKTAYLILADGTVFTGKSFGCEGEDVYKRQRYTAHLRIVCGAADVWGSVKMCIRDSILVAFSAI